AIRDIAAAQWDACANPGAVLATASTTSGNRFPRLENCPQLESISQARERRDEDAAPTPDRDRHPLPGTTAGSAPIPAPDSSNADSNSSHPPFNPFIAHDFLAALEASGSAVARAGWQPQHLIAETADGSVLGVAPCYLKSHSRGEYVFDS